jgi:uncharacterized protein YukE
MANTVYDYTVIEQCNRMISQKVREMDDLAADSIQVVKGVVDNTWGGVAANGYEASAGQLRTDLEQRKDTLIRLGERLQSSSDQMQETDKAGGKRIESSI